MRRHFRLFALAVLATGAALLAGEPAAAGKRVSEDFHWTGVLPAGRTLEAHGVNGSMVFETGTGDRVEIHATKHGRRSDPAEVRVEVVQDAEGILVCAVYPGRGNACERGNTKSSTRNNDVNVDFRIVVPASARLEAHNVNGSIDVAARTGAVSVRTVNGNCSLVTRGSGEATTVNGNVKATLGRLDDGDRLEFTTVNGSITLRLPERADAEVEGSTVNGSITTDFPLHVQGRWGPRQVEGTLGGGKGRLKVTTVNGAITLAKSGTRTL